MFFYSVTFGGFSSLASPVTAGYLTAACVSAGSMVRPSGGRLADRIGGIKALSIMCLIAAVCLCITSIGLSPASSAVCVFVLATLAVITLFSLSLVKSRWRINWGSVSMTTAKI